MDIQEILIAAGATGNADICPDDTAEVVSGGSRLVFGECTQDGNGQPLDEPEGWDATEYERREDEAGAYWALTGYTYAGTDAEMVALAAKYAA